MTDAKRPLKVFLCHASADKPKVRELYRTLKRRGVQPWLDAEDLIPGQNWEVEIPKALLSSDAIIICLTKNSVDKEGYVQKEIKFALDKAMEMPDGRIFIIPTRLEDCELPFSLRQYQAVNLYEKTGYTKLMQALKLRASQLERATVELPKKGETTAEIKKVVEEKKHPEPKEEKSEIKAPKPSQDKVGVGGDVKDSVIVSGSGNVINFGEPKKPEPEKPQLKKAKPSRKSNTAIIVALIGLAGTIIAALLGSPWIEKWLSSMPVSTFETQTADATFLLTPSLPTQTLSLSTVPSLSSTLSPTNTPSLTPTFSYGPVLVSDKDGAILMYVPEGDFTMGSNDNDDERPIHNIYLNAFWIDKTEVTNRMYELCVRSNVCNLPDNIDKFSDLSYANHPVVYVSWNDASRYCSWVGRRLPTEAEWEKAARGTDARTYPWGTAGGCDRANYIYGTWCVGSTTLVGQHETDLSPYGVYDMAGNVTEWTGSLYRSYPYDPNDGRENMVSSDGAVLRGGSWNLDAGFATTTFRTDAGISYSTFDIGFRCAFSP